MSQAFSFDQLRRGRRPGRSLAARLLSWLVAALALLAAGLLAFHLWLTPRLLLRNVELTSDLAWSRAQVLAAAGLEGAVEYLRLDPREVERRLEAVPAVDQAYVAKAFPDSLSIRLVGRRPLAALLAADPQGRALPLAVDREGVVFQVGPELTVWDLPLLSGVEFAEVRAGLRLPAALRPFLEDLDRLGREEPALSRLISEIRLVPGRGERYELELFTVSHPVRLRLGERLAPESLRSALVVLDLLAGQGLLADVRELDLRTGEVVYRVQRSREEG
jgi:cell division protein FtsQ